MRAYVSPKVVLSAAAVIALGALEWPFVRVFHPMSEQQGYPIAGIITRVTTEWWPLKVSFLYVGIIVSVPLASEVTHAAPKECNILEMFKMDTNTRKTINSLVRDIPTVSPCHMLLQTQNTMSDERTMRAFYSFP